MSKKIVEVNTDDIIFENGNLELSEELQKELAKVAGGVNPEDLEDEWNGCGCSKQRT